MAYGPDTNEMMQRIAECEQGWLSLDRLNITGIPPLPAHITHLDCGNSPTLVELPPLHEGLQSLWFTHTGITRIPLLSSTMRDLICGESPISRIDGFNNGLSRLYISDTDLIEFPPFPDTLRELFIRHNPLMNRLAIPHSLKALSVVDTPLTELPSLPTTLVELCCCQCGLTELPPLPSNLSKLELVEEELLLQRMANESIKAYNKRWQELRAERVSRLRCVERCGIVKEEIVAAAWHPLRVERWLAAGMAIEDC